MTDKYQKACQEYVKWQLEIKKLSKKIGESLSGCFWEQNRNGAQSPETHLKHAYTLGVYDPENERIVYINDTPEEYLKKTCNYCYQAHLLIQQRKEARKQFGITKRRITMLGANK